MDPQQPEDRIAELERELAEAKAAARHPYRNDTLPDEFANERYSQPDSAGAALAQAPRRVPFRFLLAELLPFRWWYLFALFMISIPPIIVWIMAPALFLPATVLTLLAIYAVHFRGAWTRLALLKWGQVATVTGSEVLSQGSYYGGTTYYNVVLPVARGWTVTRPLFSGPKTKTRIRYRLDGYQGDITVGGREYIDGVVLADQRKPDRARCVTSFPYDLDRDETGNWLGRLRGRLQIGMLCWLLVIVGWVGGSFVLHQRYQAFLTSRPAATSGPHREETGPTGSTQTPTAPGEAVTINGAGETRTIDCAGNDVIVNGSENRVDIRGHCRSLIVSGRGNQVGIDVADTITANGMDNVVTFRAGEPQITTGGVANTVLPG